MVGMYDKYCSVCQEKYGLPNDAYFQKGWNPIDYEGEKKKIVEADMLEAELVKREATAKESTHRIVGFLPEVGTTFKINELKYKVTYVNRGQARFSAEPMKKEPL